MTLSTSETSPFYLSANDAYEKTQDFGRVDSDRVLSFFREFDWKKSLEETAESGVSAGLSLGFGKSAEGGYMNIVALEDGRFMIDAAAYQPKKWLGIFTIKQTAEISIETLTKCAVETLLARTLSSTDNQRFDLFKRLQNSGSMG